MNNGKNKTIEKIVSLMESDNSVDAPADLTHWAKNLYAARAGRPALSAVQKIMAVLTLDLQAGKPAFGERSAGSGQARQLFLEAGENAIDIRVTCDGKRVRIRGQLLGDGFAGGSVAIVGESFEKEIPISDLSEFQAANIPAGHYSVTIRSTEKEIVISDIDLA